MHHNNNHSEDDMDIEPWFSDIEAWSEKDAFPYFPRAESIIALIKNGFSSYILPMFGSQESEQNDKDSAIQLTDYPYIENKQCGDDERPLPNLTHRDGFITDSAISHFALGKLGLFPKANEYISASKLKSSYKKALASKHPDKTRRDSCDEFNHVQNAWGMILAEEFNPQERQAQRSARRQETWRKVILPDVAQEQKKLQAQAEDLEKKLAKITQEMQSRQLQEESIAKNMEESALETQSYLSL